MRTISSFFLPPALTLPYGQWCGLRTSGQTEVLLSRTAEISVFDVR